MSSWLPIGIIAIITGFCLLVGGHYAFHYVEWLSGWHDTPFGQVRNWRQPYRDSAFPMYMMAVCLFIVGVVSIWYNHRIRTEKKA